MIKVGNRSQPQELRSSVGWTQLAGHAQRHFLVSQINIFYLLRIFVLNAIIQCNVGVSADALPTERLDGSQDCRDYLLSLFKKPCMRKLKNVIKSTFQNNLFYLSKHISVKRVPKVYLNCGDFISTALA